MKKVIKVIGIVVLCIIALLILLIAALLIKNNIDQQKVLIPDDYYTWFKSDSVLEKKYSGLGSFDVSEKVIKSDDKVIGNFRIWYPSELESQQDKYPVIVMTNASNTAALNLAPALKRLASWGFIVIGNDDRQTGTGASTSKTLDKILELGSDPQSIFHGKVSRDNIGIIGYSQGGAGALRAVTEYENGSTYKTIFTGSAAYPFLAKNMGWEYDASKINIPWFMTAGTGSSDDSGVADINTEFGGVAPLASLVESYNKIPENVFKVRARVTGAEHEEMLIKTDGYMTAWMLYYLKNDEDASAAFIGKTAEILNNSNWQDIEKNL